MDWATRSLSLESANLVNVHCNGPNLAKTLSVGYRRIVAEPGGSAGYLILFGAEGRIRLGII
jgi:hypothetical protein